MEPTAATKIKMSSPFLSIDHDGPWLVGVILQDHAHGVTVHPLDGDGVGCLTGPVNVATVGVQAQVVKLVVHWLNTAAHYHGRLEAKGKKIQHLTHFDIYSNPCKALLTAVTTTVDLSIYLSMKLYRVRIILRLISLYCGPPLIGWRLLTDDYGEFLFVLGTYFIIDTHIF